MLTFLTHYSSGGEAFVVGALTGLGMLLFFWLVDFICSLGGKNNSDD